MSRPKRKENGAEKADGLPRPPMADRCPRCFGAGYTEATMILSMTEIEILARERPNDRLPIVTKTCTYCGGLGFV